MFTLGIDVRCWGLENPWHGTSTGAVGESTSVGDMEQGCRESCGVFGVYAPGESVANLAFYGLFALQHRGQESAGIAVSDGRRMMVVKEMGLVSQVFDEAKLAPLEGHLAVGHV